MAASTDSDSGLQGQLEQLLEDQRLLLVNSDLHRAVIIFFMQCGFAFLEAGSVRSKNTVNILIKNMLDAFLGGVSYWAIGWGLAFGKDGNLFCGGSEYFNYQLEYDQYPKWFFQFVFAATAATIVSGSIAERCQFGAYFVYSILITGWVYPPVSHWAWSGEGWLSIAACSQEQLDSEDGCPGYYKDFAGSGVVHLLGAGCSLAACFFIGARRGRFSKKGEPIDMPGHSVPLAGLGGFILIFGFLAFNGGSGTSISTPGEQGLVGLAIVNTILGASTGGLSVLLIVKFLRGSDGKWSFLLTLNGALAGMVSMCAGCNVYEPWAALVVGAGAGVTYFWVHTLMLRLKLDDPLDAVAVHGGGGLWGLLCVPFFMSAGLEEGQRGVFFDGHLAHPWTVLGVHLAAILAILSWSMFWSGLLFGGLNWLNWLRVSTEMEFKGLDMSKHGEVAYPAGAWVEYQYNKKNSSQNKVDGAAVNPAMKGTTIGGDMTMDGSKMNIDGEAYNNPFDLGAHYGQGVLPKQKPQPQPQSQPQSQSQPQPQYQSQPVFQHVVYDYDSTGNGLDNGGLEKGDET